MSWVPMGESSRPQSNERVMEAKSQTPDGSPDAAQSADSDKSAEAGGAGPGPDGAVDPTDERMPRQWHSLRRRMHAWWEGDEAPELSDLEVEPPAAEDGLESSFDNPLLARLHAWWEGYEPEALEEAGPPIPLPDPEPERPNEPEFDEAGWSDTRIAAAHLIWGEGFISPGGAEHVLDMVNPMRLDPSMSVLDLSAGTGGSTRLVSETFGTWVTGMEGSVRVTRRGMWLSEKAGISRKAPVIHYDPESLELPAGKYDCVHARESFFVTRRKTDLLKEIVGTLKSGGEVAFTDFMLRAAELDSGALRTWAKGEPVPPHPWSIEEVLQALSELKVDLRVKEDITEEYRALVVVGLEALGARVKRLGGIDRRLGEALIAEAELWARRVTVLESGDLRVFRFYARKLEMDNDGVRTMSDW